MDDVDHPIHFDANDLPRHERVRYLLSRLATEAAFLAHVLSAVARSVHRLPIGWIPEQHLVPFVRALMVDHIGHSTAAAGAQFIAWQG